MAVFKTDHFCIFGSSVQANIKSSPSNPTFVDLSAMIAYFLHEILADCLTIKCTFITKFGWNILEMTKLCRFNQDELPFLSVRVSCRTDWTRTGSSRRLSDRQALQIWTHWTIISGVPCWKSTIHSSQSLRPATHDTSMADTRQLSDIVPTLSADNVWPCVRGADIVGRHMTIVGLHFDVILSTDIVGRQCLAVCQRCRHCWRTLSVAKMVTDIVGRQCQVVCQRCRHCQLPKWWPTLSADSVSPCVSGTDIVGGHCQLPKWWPTLLVDNVRSCVVALRRLMSSKLPCRPSSVANFIKCLPAYMAVTADGFYSKHLL